jgi:hypothetical protein
MAGWRSEGGLNSINDEHGVSTLKSNLSVARGEDEV